MDRLHISQVFMVMTWKYNKYVQKKIKNKKPNSTKGGKILKDFGQKRERGPIHNLICL